jgi:hypothetical protein
MEAEPLRGVPAVLARRSHTCTELLRPWQLQLLHSARGPQAEAWLIPFLLVHAGCMMQPPASAAGALQGNWRAHMVRLVQQLHGGTLPDYPTLIFTFE